MGFKVTFIHETNLIETLIHILNMAWVLNS